MLRRTGGHEEHRDRKVRVSSRIASAKNGTYEYRNMKDTDKFFTMQGFNRLVRLGEANPITRASATLGLVLQ